MEYGKSWEKYPIEPNETWSYSQSAIAVCDITKSLPDFMYRADMIYSDTLWSLQNTNMFNKKADREYINLFSEFYNPLLRHIKDIKPKVCYLEIGKQELDTFFSLLAVVYTEVQQWKIKYYNKHDCFLLRGSNEATCFDFSNFDDTETPLLAIKNESPSIVADFCTGRGLTGLAALKYGCNFVGTELNKRKLAVFIDTANKLGYGFSKTL